MEKYIVSGINVPTKYENLPQKALLQWFKYSKKEPTCVCIQPKTKEDGFAVLKWANENFSKLEEWADKYKCPYKIRWMEEEIAKAVSAGTCSMQWDYDQLFPFCMG